MVHGSTFYSVFAAVGSFEALSGLSFGPLWVLRDSEPPGVARNAAKTFGSLKSLTLKLKALVLHNLDWAESSSIIKVIYAIIGTICNDLWESLCFLQSWCFETFKEVTVDSRTNMLTETRHTSEKNWGSAWCRISFSSRTLGSAVRLTFAYICLQPVFALQMVDPIKEGRFVLVSLIKAVASALFWSVQ